MRTFPRSPQLFALTAFLAACGPLAAGEPPPLAPAGKADSAKPTAMDVLDAHAHLELVVDSPQRRIRRVLLFAGTKSILPLQANLMQVLPAEYYVVPAEEEGITASTVRAAVSAAGAGHRTVKILDGFGHRLTDWTQDRLVRFIDSRDGRSVLLPTRSDTISMNENAGFELGVPLQLEARYPTRFRPLEDQRFYDAVVVDAEDGDVYADGARYSDAWYRGRVWNLLYGEGGDRFVTERFLFVGETTYAEMSKQVRSRVDLQGMSEQEFLEALLNKEIVRVDSGWSTLRYSPHIDVYLTAVDRGVGGRPTVVLGSPVSFLKEVVGVDDISDAPDWVDSGWFWSRRVSAFENVRDQLLAQGFEVIEIPLLYVNLTPDAWFTSESYTLTFNNGLLARVDGTPTFLAPDYAFPDHPEIDAAVVRAAAVVKQRFASLGISVKLVAGGEGSMHNQGELRCTTAVIGQ